ncbi:MAG: [Lachnospiraceae bacterium]|nr:[FeFe] hydrogenase H-cluster maturation GTPase HydF [Lachnospiraceae bacterium]
MGLNETVSAERVHISFFGRRNAGKSSLVNAVTGQNLAVVSDVKGTTTDPVKKSMELLPIGPVVIIDTPGFDDEGALGELRVQKTREILAKTDVAVLVLDATEEMGAQEQEFLALLQEKKLPFVVVKNKVDLVNGEAPAKANGDAIQSAYPVIYVSATKNINVKELKDLLGSLAKTKENNKKIVADLLEKGDVVILVTPIDESAPKGRLILPQQQTIRDIIDAGCMAFVCQDTELPQTLAALAKPPKMVITDSQAFGRVSKMVPENIPLTSFSILFARYKGDLATQVKGAAMLSKLQDGDKILIAEGCTHHRQCGDIGTVKLPNWIQKFSNAKVQIDFTSGGEFPADVSEYKLIVHCGGCMLNEAEMKHRISLAKEADVPMTNYGVAIAHVNCILKRSLELFPEVLNLL